jgi:hypothetical protein
MKSLFASDFVFSNSSVLVNKKSYLAIVLVFLLAFISGCHNEDNTIKSTAPLEKAVEMAQLYDGELTKSGVKFLANIGGSLQARMITSGGKVQIFSFQRSENDVFAVLPQDGEYEVLYLRHLIVLNNLENGKKFILQVGKEETTNLLKKLPATYFKNAQVLNGVGLSMDYAAGAKVLACATAGGYGATSCSNTCCSVSCASGYTANCGSSCECLKRQL